MASLGDLTYPAPSSPRHHTPKDRFDRCMSSVTTGRESRRGSFPRARTWSRKRDYNYCNTRSPSFPAPRDPNPRLESGKPMAARVRGRPGPPPGRGARAEPGAAALTQTACREAVAVPQLDRGAAGHRGGLSGVATPSNPTPRPAQGHALPRNHALSSCPSPRSPPLTPARTLATSSHRRRTVQPLPPSLTGGGGRNRPVCGRRGVVSFQGWRESELGQENQGRPGDTDPPGHWWRLGAAGPLLREGGRSPPPSREEWESRELARVEKCTLETRVLTCSWVCKSDYWLGNLEKWEGQFVFLRFLGYFTFSSRPVGSVVLDSNTPRSRWGDIFLFTYLMWII